ncbi:hypothetical protein LCGC14_1565270, partial [marine sediment metagenome]
LTPDISVARARPLEAPLEADVFAERGVVDIGARPGAQIPAEEGLISSQVLEPRPQTGPAILSTRLPNVRTPLDNVLAKVGGEAGGGAIPERLGADIGALMEAAKSRPTRVRRPVSVRDISPDLRERDVSEKIALVLQEDIETLWDFHGIGYKLSDIEAIGRATQDALVARKLPDRFLVFRGGRISEEFTVAGGAVPVSLDPYVAATFDQSGGILRAHLITKADVMADIGSIRVSGSKAIGEAELLVRPEALRNPLRLDVDQFFSSPELEAIQIGVDRMAGAVDDVGVVDVGSIIRQVLKEGPKKVSPKEIVARGDTINLWKMTDEALEIELEQRRDVKKLLLGDKIYPELAGKKAVVASDEFSRAVDVIVTREGGRSPPSFVRAEFRRLGLPSPQTVPSFEWNAFDDKGVKLPVVAFAHTKEEALQKIRSMFAGTGRPVAKVERVGGGPDELAPLGPGTFPGPEAEGVVFKKPTEIGPIEEAAPTGLGKQMAEDAFNRFGVALSPEDTVFVLPDGRAIGGGKIKYPITDPSHDIVLTVIPEDIKAGLLRTGDPGIDTLPFFMQETGAVRIRAQADELLVETIGPVTAQQKAALGRLSAQRSTFFVDVTSTPRGIRARPESVQLGSRREFLEFIDNIGKAPTEAVPIGLTTKEASELDKLQGIKGKLSNRQTARLSELEAKATPLEPPAPNPFEIGGFSRARSQMRGPRGVEGGPAAGAAERVENVEQFVADRLPQFATTEMDLRALESGQGTFRMYHGTPSDFADDILAGGFKQPPSGEEAIRRIAQWYDIPEDEFIQYGILPFYGEETSRISTSSAAVAARWAETGSFPRGEIFSNLNSNARLHVEIVNRLRDKGVKLTKGSYDAMYNRLFKEAEELGVGRTVNHRVADILKLPDQFPSRTSGGTLLELTIDVSRVNNPRDIALTLREQASAPGSYFDVKVPPDAIKGIRPIATTSGQARIPADPLGGFPSQFAGRSRALRGGPAPDDLGGFSRGGDGGRIGGGGTIEGGPPFEGSEGEEAIAKLTELINQAKKPRRGQTLLQHEELQRRFKIVAERLRTGEGTPEEIAGQARAALGGPQPKAQFEPVRPFMTESEVQSLYARANTFDFGLHRVAENVRAVDALTKVLTGTLPQQAEMELLEKVFGAQLIKALQAKGP